MSVCLSVLSRFSLGGRQPARWDTFSRNKDLGAQRNADQNSTITAGRPSDRATNAMRREEDFWNGSVHQTERSSNLV